MTIYKANCITPDVIRRFEEKYIPVPEAGCWLWTASTTRGGYGQLGVKGYPPGRAHVISYMIYKGDIPEGMFVCHKCDTPSCVNPDHLFLGTCADNSRDMMEKGRHVPISLKGVINPKAKLTEEQVYTILADTRTAPWVARDYGVGEHTIRSIRNGITWKHLPRGPKVKVVRSRHTDEWKRQNSIRASATMKKYWRKKRDQATVE